jgi:Fe-S-cluster formation regulator IscX/YfhJ
LKKGAPDSQFKFLKENVMSLDENSEDEDYEAAATKRVQEAVQSILMEEEEEMGMQA